MVSPTWLPVLTTSGLFALGLWLARNLILTRLTRSVGHEFDAKLADLQAKLRESEERFKADLRVKEAEISTLRSGAISTMASRQIALDKRRLEAVDQLWSAFISLKPARTLCNNLAVLKIENVAKQAEHDPRMRAFLETIGSGFDISKLDSGSASRSQPFVSPMVWANYSAYMAICMNAVITWNTMRIGLGDKKLTDIDLVKKLIIKALPDSIIYVDNLDSNDFHFLLDELEEKLLQELRAMLTGAETDKASVEHAAEIVKLANAVNLEAHSMPPGG